MINQIIAALFLVTNFAVSAPAFEQESKVLPEVGDTNMMDELDPFDPNIEQKLLEMDKQYEQETGMSPFMESSIQPFSLFGCRKDRCKVWIQVVKSRQTAYLYQDGQLTNTWLVSTGTPNRETPTFEGHPNGRIYDKYTSTKYPEGDYRGLGNMPYAVFYNGGFAIHGTTPGNFKRLGTRASHGCTRLHPDNGYTFNRLVRQYGIKSVWISIVN